MRALRVARAAEIPDLRVLIEASVRGLQAEDYSVEQMEGALGAVFGVDSQLIADQTYFVVVEGEGQRVVGCGGWSRRRTLFGGDQAAGRQTGLLDPGLDAAKIRAFFVHPDFARQGIGSQILTACERAAGEEGFKSSASRWAPRQPARGCTGRAGTRPWSELRCRLAMALRCRSSGW